MLDDRQQKALEIIRVALSEELAARLDEKSLLAFEIADLALDSLAKMDLILTLEVAFACMLDEVEIAQCRTVQDLVRLATAQSA